MDLLNLIPALIFATVGVVAIIYLLKPFILALKPYLPLKPSRKKPHLYQVKPNTKSKSDDKPDDIVYH